MPRASREWRALVGAAVTGLVLAVVLALAAQAARNHHEDAPVRGQLVADGVPVFAWRQWRARTLTDATIRDSEWFLVFTAAGCRPCREAHAWVRTHSERARVAVIVLGDSQEQAATGVDELVGEFGQHCVVALTTHAEARRVFHLARLPTLLLVTRGERVYDLPQWPSPAGARGERVGTLAGET